MPGRAVDIVLAAVHRAGLEAYTFSLFLNAQRLTVHLWRREGHRRTPEQARAVFAQLGVDAGAVTLDRRTGFDHSSMEADVPVLGGLRLDLVIDPVPEVPEPVDPADLIADVDAARAAEAAQADLGNLTGGAA